MLIMRIKEMASYNFKCTNCDEAKTHTMPVKDFVQMTDNLCFESMFCSKCCEEVKFVRIFGSSSSKIKMSKEEAAYQIMDDVRKVVEKVKSGNSQAIRDIYGEDI